MVYHYGGHRYRRAPGGELLRWSAASDQWTKAPMGIVLRPPEERLGLFIMRLARTAVSATVTTAVLALVVITFIAVARIWI